MEMLALLKTIAGRRLGRFATKFALQYNAYAEYENFQIKDYKVLMPLPFPVPFQSPE